MNNRKDYVIENYSLILADILGILVSYPLAFFVRYRKFSGVLHNTWAYVLILALIMSILLHILLGAEKGYFSRGLLKEMVGVLFRGILLFIALAAMVFIFKWGKTVSRLFLGYFVIIDFAISFAIRIIFKHLFLHDFKLGKRGDRVFLVTSSDLYAEVYDKIFCDENWSFKISAVAFTDKDMTGQTLKNINVVASKDTLLKEIRSIVADAVFVYHPGLSDGELKELIEAVEMTGMACYYSIELPASQMFKIRSEKFAGIPVLTYYSLDFDYRKRIIKRIIDIIGSLVGLTITLLVFPFVAIAIKLDSKGPIFFSQYRAGKNGRPFRMYKFRSMYVGADEKKAELMKYNEMDADGFMFKMKDDPRVTRVGKFIRKTSIDELPQFFNVLKGDMSLVGTRPPVLIEYEKYDEQIRRRLSTRPGLTGLWQVSGRSSITDFKEILKLDLAYIDNWSLYLDLKILLKTIGVIFLGKGAE